MDILSIVHESPEDDFPDLVISGNVYASWNTVAKTGARIPPTWSNDWSNLCYEHGLSTAKDMLNYGPTRTHRSHGRM
jgi:hypothetical protein